MPGSARHSEGKVSQKRRSPKSAISSHLNQRPGSPRASHDLSARRKAISNQEHFAGAWARLPSSFRSAWKGGTGLHHPASPGRRGSVLCNTLALIQRANASPSAPSDAAKASLMTTQTKLDRSWAILLESWFLQTRNTTCQGSSNGGTSPMEKGRGEGLSSPLGCPPCTLPPHLHGDNEELRYKTQRTGARTPHLSTCSTTLASPRAALQPRCHGKLRCAVCAGRGPEIKELLDHSCTFTVVIRTLSSRCSRIAWENYAGSGDRGVTPARSHPW